MSSNRKGETGYPPPSSSRMFNMESVWYFSTREGADIGPFNSRLEASHSRQDFVQFIQLANNKTLGVFLSALNIQDRQSLVS